MNITDTQYRRALLARADRIIELLEVLAGARTIAEVQDPKRRREQAAREQAELKERCEGLFEALIRSPAKQEDLPDRAEDLFPDGDLLIARELRRIASALAPSLDVLSDGAVFREVRQCQDDLVKLAESLEAGDR